MGRDRSQFRIAGELQVRGVIYGCGLLLEVVGTCMLGKP